MFSTVQYGMHMIYHCHFVLKIWKLVSIFLWRMSVAYAQYNFLFYHSVKYEGWLISSAECSYEADFAAAKLKCKSGHFNFHLDLLMFNKCTV